MGGRASVKCWIANMVIDFYLMFKQYLALKQKLASAQIGPAAHAKGRTDIFWQFFSNFNMAASGCKLGIGKEKSVLEWFANWRDLHFCIYNSIISILVNNAQGIQIYALGR